MIGSEDFILKGESAGTKRFEELLSMRCRRTKGNFAETGHGSSATALEARIDNFLADSTVIKYD
jgi:hypothetical protein